MAWAEAAGRGGLRCGPRGRVARLSGPAIGLAGCPTPRRGPSPRGGVCFDKNRGMPAGLCRRGARRRRRVRRAHARARPAVRHRARWMRMPLRRFRSSCMARPCAHPTAGQLKLGQSRPGSAGPRRDITALTKLHSEPVLTSHIREATAVSGHPCYGHHQARSGLALARHVAIAPKRWPSSLWVWPTLSM